MSLAYTPLSPVLTEIPEIKLTSERVWSILKGSKSNIFMNYPTQTSNSQSVSFTIVPPSIHNVIDRVPLVSFPVRLTLTGVSTASGQMCIVPHQFSINAFPISHATTSLTSSINGTQFDIQLSQALPGLLRYNNGINLTQEDYSMCPGGLSAVADPSSAFGSIKDVNAGYLDSNLQSIMGNAGFSFTVVQNDVSTGSGQTLTAIVDFVSTEPIFCPPWCQGKSRVPGFYNVTQILLNYTMASNAAYFMINQNDGTSGGLPMTITSGQVQFSNFSGAAWSYPGILTPTLFMKYYSLPEDLVIPPDFPLSYQASKIQVFPTQGSSVAQNVSSIISSQMQVFPVVPDKIFIWVQRWQNDLIASPKYSKDSYFAIDKISCLVGEQDSQLAGASQQQLYQCCCRNGLKMDFTSWSGQPIQTADWSDVYYGAGTVLCLSIPEDLTLNSTLLAPGSPAQVGFQVQVTCRNLSTISATPILYIMPIYASGVYTITSSGSSIFQLGVSTAIDVLDARSLSGTPSTDYSDLKDTLKVGEGDFFSGLKNLASRAVKGAIEYGPKLNQFLRDSHVLSSATGRIPNEYGQIASQGLRQLGYGRGRKRKSRKGGVLLGGEVMSRDELRSMRE